MLYAGTSSTLVLRPLNTAVVQGSAVTLQCSSDNSSAILLWYNSTCLTLTNNDTSQCINDLVYSGHRVTDKFPPGFHVTAENNGTHVTRDLNINSTQLTDAGVYLCAETGPGAPILDLSSAQLIVLGNLYSLI